LPGYKNVGKGQLDIATFISGNDVYVAVQKNNGKAVILKNRKVLYTFAEYAEPHSVIVDGSDVYTAGYEMDEIKVWKNNTELYTLGSVYNEQGSTTTYGRLGFCISNGNIYVAGSEWNSGKYVAKLWINGIGKDLSDGTVDCFATSVFVFDEDVYVAGVEGSNNDSRRALLWKNGEMTTLAIGDVAATSVFIVP